MKKILLLAILLLFVLYLSVMWAGRIWKNDKHDPSVEAFSLIKPRLSLDKLEKATLIIYQFNNGTVAPDFHYDGYIKVTKDSVNVTIFRGYNSDVKFNESRELSPDEYKQFLNRLVQQKIRKATPSKHNRAASGSHVSYIAVWQDDELIFDGSEHLNLSIADGRLDDAFMDLLSGDMEIAAHHPMKIIDPRQNPEE